MSDKSEKQKHEPETKPPETPEEKAANQRKRLRNLIIALVLLAFLALEPFWMQIKSTVTGEEITTGASQEA